MVTEPQTIDNRLDISSPTASASDSPTKARGRRKKKHTLSKLAIRGVVFNWVGRGASFMITFITTPLLIYGLGNESYGLWAIVMGFVGYYALADIGLQGGVIKYISEYQATGNREALARIFRAALTTYTGIALIVLVLSAPIAWVFPLMFKLEQENLTVLRWAIFLAGVSVALRMQAQVFIGTIRALKRFDIANVISVVSQIASAILSLSLLYSGMGLLGVSLGTLIVSTITRASQSIIAYRLLGGIQLRGPKVDRESLKMLLTFGGWNVTRQLAGQVHLKSGPLIGGLLLGPAMVPFYAVANALSEKTQSLIKGVVGIVMPVASHLEAQDRKSDLLALMVIVPRSLMPMSLFIFIFAVCFGDEFIRSWIDASYVALTYPIACLLTASNVAATASRGINAMFIGRGHLARVTWLSVGNAIAFLVMSVALIPLFGLIGLALAVMIPSFLFNLVILPAYACRVYEYSFIEYHVRVFVRPTISVIPAALVAFALNYWIPPTRMLEVISYTSMVMLLAAICSYYLCFDAELRSKIILSLGGRHRKRANKPPAGPQESCTVVT